MRYKNWGWNEVAYYNGISFNPRKEEITVMCPFCGKKRFAMNTRLETGHCWSCSNTADIAGYHAALNGMSVEEARKDLDDKVGAKEENFVRPERIVYQAPPQQEMAKISILDHTYRSFLAELSLSEKNRAMLLARGFNNEDIDKYGYKTFPAYSDEFYAICKRLLLNGCTLEGVPGFFQTKKGDWTFIRCTQGIIIPQKTVNNQIFGLQIRKDDDLRVFNEERGELEEKCIWFSSKNCRNGCGARADINFSCDFKYDQKTEKYWIYTKSKKIILTEGGMKADLIHAFEPDMPVMSVAGVKAYTYLEKTMNYLRKLGVETIVHAYDMDYKSNPNVADALIKTKEIIESSGMNYVLLEWDTNVPIDGQNAELLKGLDDYLAYHKKGIVPKIKSKDE